ncbi:type VI secretion system Vgr family protein [Acinetobacter rudis]|uniref:Type VI secretion system secreted protein VgrG n=1 Tax=Acinetobacter rudis CIP 110305 TaxID=421052 RepID=S3N2F6_9GAMM|nr:type VI secretion system Vgr family protein [Acinetobacter rudis]EPF71086.1 hypothetical protein F945_02849 [Acinetobacter rudis CIP 110305]EPF74235.1 hypothetical protein F945_01602 [Acinetobacter rudis CIP 110305]
MNHQVKLFGVALPQSEYGTSFFWFDSLSGHEKINELFEYQLVVKVRDEFHQPAHGYQGLEGYVSKQTAESGGSPASDLNLQSLIGTELAVRLRLDGTKVAYGNFDGINNITSEENYQSSLNGARFYRGLVNRVEVLGVRNRHAMYKITLVPWLWLLTKSSNYRIFQQKTVLQIIEQVLESYAYPVDYRCSADYPVLDFQAQYGETDFDFICRLLQEHGINFHFEHSQNNLTWVLSDHNAAYKEMEAPGYRNLSIYPPNQRFPEGAEYIEHFEPVQQLVSGKIQLSDYQFKQPTLVQTAQDQFLWDHQHAEQEVYEWQQGDFLSAEEGGQSRAQQRVEGLYQHGYRAEGQARLKGLQTGYRFELENHPNSESNRGWLVLGTQTLIQDISQERADNQFYDSQVKFLVQPDEQILRPDRTLSKPHGRPQTATVVGPAGEEIHTDQYGRVKVKFHWDRRQGGLNDEYQAGDGLNCCWLRVSTAWAGNNFGTIHLPRIGQEVIVDFFNGDPDMPFVAGRLTNPEQMPVWELPDQKALSGIKSKELGGNQANQLVMDDTQGQVQVHLKSDHQASELNLGYITRIPDSKGRKDFRGEGFELRTDGHGVVRSAQGLILTSYEKNKADSYVKHLEETIKQLQGAVEQHKSQIQIAIDQKADEREIEDTAQQELNTQFEQIEGEKGTQLSELNEPHVVMSGPAGVAVVAEQSIHLNSVEHIALTSGKDISLATSNRLFTSASQGIRLFAENNGARLFAGNGDIQLQAQAGGLDAQARKKVQIHSIEEQIELSSPDEIMFTAGDSSIKINGSGVFISTTGVFEVKAAEHLLTSAAGAAVQRQLPQPKPTQGALELLRSYGGDHFFKQNAFKVIDILGKEVSGNLDENGFAQVTGIAPGTAKVVFEKDEMKAWDQASDFGRDYTWADDSILQKLSSGGALAALGNNMMSKLKDNVFSLNSNRLKDIAQNVLKDGAEQMKQQLMSTALEAASNTLNIGLSPNQLGSIAEMVNQVTKPQDLNAATTMTGYLP